MKAVCPTRRTRLGGRNREGELSHCVSPMNVIGKVQPEGAFVAPRRNREHESPEEDYKTPYSAP